MTVGPAPLVAQRQHFVADLSLAGATADWQVGSGWPRTLPVRRSDAPPVPSLSRFDLAVKRSVDVVLASLLLLLFAPILLVTIAIIRIESAGSPIFRQTRVGRQGRTFTLFKLRSMRVDADDAEHQAYVAALIRGEAERSGTMFKLTNDSRITKVGRVLRRLSLDELPQLVNVLRGDMSMVGPRPSLPREVSLYDDRARQRLAVKPGITGLWQVSGRCELDFDAMTELDIRYWLSWSFVGDLAIIVKTPFAMLSGRGAA